MKSTRVIHLGKVAGLEISTFPITFVGLLVLWVIFSLAGWAVGLNGELAVLGGLLAALLHYLSELWHNLGHNTAARRVGYPMQGMRYWLFLALSIYPKDEPELSAAIHIRRATGVPIASFLLTVAAGLLALLLCQTGGLPFWLAFFLFIDNLLVFTIGALLPLGFTDGSTLLHWMRK